VSIENFTFHLMKKFLLWSVFFLSQLCASRWPFHIISSLVDSVHPVVESPKTATETENNVESPKTATDTGNNVESPKTTTYTGGDVDVDTHFEVSEQKPGTPVLLNTGVSDGQSNHIHDPKPRTHSAEFSHSLAAIGATVLLCSSSLYLFFSKRDKNYVTREYMELYVKVAMYETLLKIKPK
jgi:hypothetical protein